MEKITAQKIPFIPRGISLDSRKIKKADLFVALRGEKTDGHHYIHQAQEKGAVGALVASAQPEVDIPQIVSESPETTISHLAKSWRSNFSLPVMGVTGSNGKTTTRNLLIHIFSGTDHVHGTEGNFNTRLGLSLTLLKLTSHHTLCILEMGANQMGDIGFLCSLSLPRYGIITNIAPAHLQGFGSIENIAREKGELFHALPEDGIAFVNFDDSYIRQMPTRSKIRVTYGFSSECNFSANLRRNKNGLVILTINGNEIPTHSYDISYAKNVAATCAVSITLGIPWDQLKEQAHTFSPPKGRCTIKKFQEITVIDDTYNANLTSTLSALELLVSYPARGRRMMVFGDMLELGSESKDHHKIVGEKVAEKGLHLLFCVGVDSIYSVESAQKKINARHYDDKHKLARDLKSEMKEGDIVLFKGSRGSAMETVIEEIFPIDSLQEVSY